MEQYQCKHGVARGVHRITYVRLRRDVFGKVLHKVSYSDTHSAWGWAFQTPHTKLTPGWAFIRVNLDPIQEIGPKVADGHCVACGTLWWDYGNLLPSLHPQIVWWNMYSQVGSGESQLHAYHISSIRICGYYSRLASIFWKASGYQRLLNMAIQQGLELWSHLCCWPLDFSAANHNAMTVRHWQ